MKKPKPLNYKILRKSLDPKELSFDNTDQLTVSIDYLVQQRAMESIEFGIGLKSQGYNFFVMGPRGIGKRSLMRTILKSYGQSQTRPADWCYIYNFDVPDQPIAVKLPPGYGLLFKKSMDAFVQEVKLSILSVYESDTYKTEMQKINAQFDGEIKKKSKTISKKNSAAKITNLYKKRLDAESKLQAKLTEELIAPIINKIKHKFDDYPKIITFLDAVQQDVLTNVDNLVKEDEPSSILLVDSENPILTHYEVNLLVDNLKQEGAPVIIEDNPTYSNLISRLEYKIQQGNLVTDFTLIKAGALHRANGGYLILEANKIWKNKFVWESLKNALFTGKITIESPEQASGAPKSVSIKPKSIPLKIKIVLVGDRNLYYKLSRIDPDFNELFKVAVDFDDIIERNKNNIEEYANYIGSLVNKRNLRAFDRSAVAAIIDYSTRLAEDVEKLSTYTNRIDELIREADYWAKDLGKKIVDAVAVKRAIEARIHRMDRSRDLYYEYIQRNFILIQTKHLAIGQVNCLSVVRVGNFSYGHPTRITAKVRPGKGTILDIQRDVKLAGAVHSKAVLILANYFATQYSPDTIFSLAASLSFEQIYGEIDGDSASLAELCALISALTNIPLKQSLSITGSVNQDGQVQPIGGVNVKIEGYFDICKARGLTGDQGVIIPTTNLPNLMLREDIVKACKANKFFIYAVSTVDEAVTLLTGMDAGVRNKNGDFPAGSVNSQVEARLKEFSQYRLVKIKK